MASEHETLLEYYQLSKLDRGNKIKESSREFFLGLNNKDELFTVIIKGHLLIENSLENLLKKFVENYKVLNYKYFSEKLNLCYALELIPESTYRALNQVNKIRNKYGHDINFKFEEKHLDDMISSLSKNDKLEYEENCNYFKYKDLYKKVNYFMHFIFTSVKISEETIHFTKRDKTLKWQIELMDECKKYYTDSKE